MATVMSEGASSSKQMAESITCPFRSDSSSSEEESNVKKIVLKMYYKHDQKCCKYVRVACFGHGPFKCYFHYKQILRWLKLKKSTAEQNVGIIFTRGCHEFLDSDGVRKLLTIKYPSTHMWHCWFEEQVKKLKLEMQRKSFNRVVINDEPVSE